MPFLAPLIPALIGGAASAAAGAGINAIGRAVSGTDQKANPQKVDPNTVGFNQANLGKVDLAQPVSGAQAGGSIQGASGALDQQQALLGALQGQQGIQNQSNVYGQQQALASQLGLMASGQGGPSIAQTQLANATGANVANQAALMAGQRGAGANAGLIARQAGQQGAAAQQQLAGQASSLRAQEQLNAIGALQNQQGMLGNLAGQQVGQQTSATGNLNQFAQGQQGQLLSALQGQNAQSLAQQQGLNQLGASQQSDINRLNLQQQQGVNDFNLRQAQGANNINAQMAQQQNEQVYDATKGIAGGLGSGLATGVTKLFAQGGEVPNLKENYKGKSRIGGHLMMKVGGVVPGKINGPRNVDTVKNDKVPAMLSPGEIVLPNSITQAKDPVVASAKFVAALKAKKGK